MINMVVVVAAVPLAILTPTIIAGLLSGLVKNKKNITFMAILAIEGIMVEALLVNHLLGGGGLFLS